LRFFASFIFFVTAAFVAWADSNVVVRSSTCDSKRQCAQTSVVSLLPDWPDNFTRNEEPEGSAVVLSKRLIATADHVIGPAKSARIRTARGEILRAEIVWRNLQTDIAFLRVEKDMVPFTLGQDYAMGDKACAIGNSFGLDISMTCGVISATGVSGVGFNAIEDFVQTDAAVNPGMSGGALVDDDGRLIGMLSAIFTKQSDANIGVNFAVSAALLKRIHDDFSDDLTVELQKSGLLLRPARLSETGGLTGMEVMRVIPGSPEAAAGIMPGDVIHAVNGMGIKKAGRYEAVLALWDKTKPLDVELLSGENTRLARILPVQNGGENNE